MIFEEFRAPVTPNSKLDRKIAERRVFPAVDVNPSGTRKGSCCCRPTSSPSAQAAPGAVGPGLPSGHRPVDEPAAPTKTNYEFLVQVSKTAPRGAWTSTDRRQGCRNAAMPSQQVVSADHGTVAQSVQRTEVVPVDLRPLQIGDQLAKLASIGACPGGVGHRDSRQHPN